MSGIFGGGRTKATTTPTDTTTANTPVAPAGRSDAETASLAAEQVARYTRRRGRAFSQLTGGAGTTGGMSVARTLGSVART